MIPSMGKHVLSVSASSVLSALILLSGVTAPAAQEAIDPAEIVAAELDTAEPRIAV